MRKYLALTLLFLTTQASAGFLSYKAFLEMADSSSDVKTTYIHGYVIGIADQLQDEGHICIPATTKVKQVTSRVVELLQITANQPDAAELPAGPLVHMALRNAYACAGRGMSDNDLKYKSPKFKPRKDFL